MIGLVVSPALDPAALAWLPAVFAAASGLALHLMLPPPQPDVAEALLIAAVHP
jgi:hypothetical protein